MGPNGTGKSTLAKALAGHPDYKITSGEVLLDGRNLLEMSPEERSRAGLLSHFNILLIYRGLVSQTLSVRPLTARIAGQNEV
jgi:Fe-S cluster assembly ATP-binding protein